VRAELEVLRERADLDYLRERARAHSTPRCKV
jgi:hypothetical protein